ncbi:Pvc16 family protein [Accumulibacter sp.]|uniref:Pvc16 family protein n=1 Tax=Accumulibacter sp. TaxID=2053492 RepID=UPI0025FFB3BB|nr:Pvc16 family protein [Accumulibacter sp.]MCM8596507.1 Pvc16 family protein [Accumulibacter sp.]MCM8627321.1 Pvc16 family protein [Accumulibacter sp.]MDS4050655.1 Pvc16 family protein [Accumulibacter sp.]
MIRDLSLSLRGLLDDPALAPDFPELATAQIAFDRPAEQFSPSQTTIDLFLYDVRENLELRSNETLLERQNGQAVIQRPPLRVACTYLVTAWPVGGMDLPLQEHRLLSQALQVLSRHPTIPAAYLQGSLVGQKPPLPMLTAQTDGIKDPADFWTAIGGKLRPSIQVTATLAMARFPAVTAPLVITEQLALGERLGAGSEALAPATRLSLLRIGGRVTNAASQPLANARVTLVDSGVAAITDSSGRYTLAVPQAGSFVVRVDAGASSKTLTITVPVGAGDDYDVDL